MAEGEKMSEKKSYQAWTISDEFWEAIKDEIPKKSGPGKEIQKRPRSRTETGAGKKGSGGHILCAADRLPVESAAP